VQRLSLQGRTDVDLRRQGLVNRALVGDLQQPLPLTVVECAGQLNFAVDMSDPSLGRLAVSSIFGVNA
jgi:hypothetical protein